MQQVDGIYDTSDDDDDDEDDDDDDIDDDDDDDDDDNKEDEENEEAENGVEEVNIIFRSVYIYIYITGRDQVDGFVLHTKLLTDRELEASTGPSMNTGHSPKT